jgi:hypothetical protein
MARGGMGRSGARGREGGREGGDEAPAGGPFAIIAEREMSFSLF